MSNAIRDALSKQNAITRKNLLAVGRLSTQTLCDEAGVTGVIDDCSEQLVNFCNIIEAILCHKYVVNKKQAGSSEGIMYWEFIKQACKSVPYNCISKIAQIDDAKTPRGKGRAWIRMALMEKRLSEYLSVALMEETVIKRFYERGAFFLNEEAHILANVLTALNSVDFSLCLRNSSLDLPICYQIDYSCFLKYPISDKQLDLEEALIRMERNRAHNDCASSTCSGPSIVSEREQTVEEELAKLKRTLKGVVDQKAYLEEILHLREAKCTELTQQLLTWDEQVEKEKALSDSIIVELQEQLSALQLKNQHLLETTLDPTVEEMDAVLVRSRHSVNLHRPAEGIDVVAEMEQNGHCSRSSSEQSVKKSISDKTVKKSLSDVSVKRSITSESKRSVETVKRSSDSLNKRSSDSLNKRSNESKRSADSGNRRSAGDSGNNRTSSLSSRPRAKSRPATFSKQKIAVAVEDILPSEKEKLLFTVHKKMQQESFISFGETDS